MPKCGTYLVPERRRPARAACSNVARAVLTRTAVSGRSRGAAREHVLLLFRGGYVERVVLSSDLW